MNESVLFERLAPIPPSYPKPWYPMLPVMGRTGAPREIVRAESRFLRRDVIHTGSGAAAIFHALSDAGIGPGDDVLVPAYHCPTMVFPVLAIGANPVLVPIDEDLALDVGILEVIGGARARALLLPHFFGFIQPALDKIKAWSRARDAVLIEDCAHAFYGLDGGFLPGCVGDYAIASTRKFFPGTEGGALVANGRTLDCRLTSAPISLEVRSVLDTLHLAARLGNLTFARRAGPFSSRGELDGPTDEQAALDEARPQPPSEEEIASSMCWRHAARSTVAMIRGADHARSASVRRARYARWKSRVELLSGVRTLRNDDPGSGVPYVFPAVLEDPERQFVRLKYAGVQVWRWDRLARSDCAVSRRYALELVQLPCQQSFDDSRFEALLDAFSEAVTS